MGVGPVVASTGPAMLASLTGGTRASQGTPSSVAAPLHVIAGNELEGAPSGAVSTPERALPSSPEPTAVPPESAAAAELLPRSTDLTAHARKGTSQPTTTA